MKLVKLLSDYFVIKDGDTIVASTESTDEVQQLSLLKIKELIGEPRSRELFLEDLKNRDIHPLEKLGTMKGFMLGWGLCEGENQDKKYTEEDLRKAIDMARGIADDSAHDTFTVDDITGCTEICTYGWREKYSNEKIIQSLQPCTEWDVEFVNSKITLI